jgi:thiol-disulfide isomerase/thioredoxin
VTRFPSIGKSLGQLVGVLAIVVVAACSGSGANDRVLPDEQLEQLDGGTYDLRQTGEPRALNLWATWCAPCRAELPAFDDVAGRVEGAEIIGINVGESGADAAELVAELDLGFRQLLDPSATVQQTLRITGMPSTIFVDGSGQVVDVHAGELDTDELEAKLAVLFGATFRS